MHRKVLGLIVVIPLLGLGLFFNANPQLRPSWWVVGGKRRPAWAQQPRAGDVLNPFIPSAAEAAFERGLTALDNEKWDKAVKEFSEVVKLEPDDADAWFNRGLAYHYLEDYDKAIADYDQAIRLEDEDSDYYYNRAEVHWIAEHLELALADLQKCLSLSPHDADAWWLRGAVHEDQQDYRQAAADYEKAVEYEPEHRDALNGLAWILAAAPDKDLRNGERAMSLASRAVELDEGREWDTLDTLAAACAEQGKFNEAVQFQNEALKRAPTEEQVEVRARLQLYRSGAPYRLDPAPPAAVGGNQ